MILAVVGLKIVSPREGVEAMGDVFEPTREAIRHLQAKLRGEEDYRAEAMEAIIEQRQRMEMTEEEYWLWERHTRERIRAIEHEIVKLMCRIPPQAVERDGCIELLPIWERWQMPNPRTVV
jgi:hypothetical protein